MSPANAKKSGKLVNAGIKSVTINGNTNIAYGANRKIQVLSVESTSSFRKSFRRSRYGCRMLGPRLD